MSASVYLACSKATRNVSHGTVRLTLDTQASDAPRAPEGGMLILGRSSLPLYAIRQQDTETDTAPQQA